MPAFCQAAGRKKGGWGGMPGVPGAPGLNPGGTGYPCRLRSRRGGRGGGRLPTLPLWCPAGSLPALPPAYPAFGLPFCPLSPQPPSPAGKGETYSFLMQGASPLAFPGLNPGGTGYPCRLRSRRGAGGLAPARHWLSLPRGRGPSQTPKFLSPGPPSPWLPAPLIGKCLCRFCAAPQAPCAGCPHGRYRKCRGRLNAGDARGEAPCIRKQKNLPLPTGKGGQGGWGQEIKPKAG